MYKNWPLGHGAYRVAGNVGPLTPAIADAKDNGFDDVLWMLDGYIKEMTFINVFVLLKSRFGKLELITPPNDGCIFNGSLRQSVLDLAPIIEKDYKEKPLYDEGLRGSLKVIERNVSITELLSASQECRLLEVFGGATFCNF